MRAGLLSQAEHDELASCILVTDNEAFAEKVSEYIDGFVEILERKEIIQCYNYDHFVLSFPGL